MSPHAAPPRFPPSPSTKTALSVDCPVQLTARFRKTTLFQDSHDTCPRTFHARSHFPGRSCVFPGDLPCQSPFSWKVLRFSGGPSMPGAIFPEGPAFFRGTFHARGHFPGRSCLFPVDEPPLCLHHPPKWFFWWTNLASSGLVLSGHRAAGVFLVQRGKRGESGNC